MTELTLYEWFAASVARYPDAPALEIQELNLTYRDLDAVVERLAGRIVAAHGRVPERVGLLVSRSLVAYAGYLAVLRLGAAVVPLNPIFPPSRNLAISAAAALDAVLVDDAGAAQLPGLGPDLGTTVADLPDRQWRSVVTGPVPADLPVYDGRVDDVAYILFTSGSTGRPKGVPIQHANVSPYLEFNIAKYGIGPGCRLSQTFDLTFDPSVFDLFVAWGSGATLVVPQKNEVLTPVQYVNSRRITHWFSVPSIVSFARRLRALQPGCMPTLQLSLFAGEQLTIEQADAWRRAAPGCVIENIYGPTELTVTCTGYRLPPDRGEWPVTSNQTVPIGTVYPHLEYVILDENGRPADEGELCVRGAQRFPGYLDPASNASRFTAFDGTVATVYDGTGPLTAEHWYRTGDRVRRDRAELVHLGRLDHQLKIRGYRVELGEIEAVLRGHTRIREAVVLASTSPDGEVDLVAVYTGEQIPEDELVAVVRGRLPVYMLPRRYEHIAEMPLNDNGKTDRNRIAAGLDLVGARTGGRVK
jgi:amino acid adenylation domain-containing protein